MVIPDRQLQRFLDHVHDDRMIVRVSDPGTNLKARSVLAEDEGLLLVDASRGSVLVILPRSEEGREYRVKRIDPVTGNKIVIKDRSNGTIDGASQYSLTTQWQVVHLVCSGQNWYVLT